MAAVAIILDGCDLAIDTHRGNQTNKSQLALYKALIHCNS